MNRSASLDDNFKNCMDKVKLGYILLASKYKEIEENPLFTVIRNLLITYKYKLIKMSASQESTPLDS